MRRVIFFVIAAIFIAANFFYFQNVKTVSASPTKVLISEIQTAGVNSVTDEFIELYNPSSSTISLANWKIIKKTSSGNENVLVAHFDATSTISANGHYLIAHKNFSSVADYYYTNSSYSIADNNSILLINDMGEISDLIGYGQAAEFETATNSNPLAGQSLERKKDEFGNLIDTENNFNDLVINIFPTPQIASTTTETDDDTEENSTTTDSDIQQKTSTTTDEAVEYLSQPGDVLINEFVSFPPSGESEWIELINKTDKIINITGWTISDNSSEFNLTGEIGTSTDKYFVYTFSSPKLNNDGDTINLKNASGTVIDAINYGNWPDSEVDDPQINQAVARSNNDWSITTSLTPGAENIITIPEIISRNSSSYVSADNQNSSTKSIILPIPIIKIDKNPAYAKEKVFFDAGSSTDANNDSLKYTWDFGDNHKSYQKNINHVFEVGNYKISLKVTNSEGNSSTTETILMILPEPETEEEEIIIPTASKKTAVKSTKKSTITNYLKISLQQAQAQELDTKVIVQGLVAVEPGILGSQIFYLADEQLPAGVQIYCFKKDFPELKLGQKVEIKGTISSINNEKRIKITNREDIKILDQNELVVQPMQISEISQELIGALIEIEGTIIENKANNLIVADEDSEILIQIKKSTGITTLPFKESDQIKIIGIVSQNKNGIILLPRYINDLTASGKVLGETEIQISPPNFWLDNKYFIAIIIFLVAVIFLLLWKHFKLKKKSWHIEEE